MKLSAEQASEFRELFGNNMELYSSFTHVEGKSHLSSYWTEIETTYSLGDFILFRIRQVKEEKDSLEKYTFELLKHKD